MTETTIMMLVWLIIFLGALIAELVTEALVSAWFCIGAVVALGVTFIPGMPWWGDVIVFFAVSAVALFALRPLANKLLTRRQSKTNVDAIIGKKGKIVKKVTELDNGTVKINGVIWTAVLTPGTAEIEEGKIVSVVSIEGNKLYVKEIEG